MRHGHIPPKKCQDKRAMRRREDSRFLAAERATGAVQLQEHARLVQQQALGHHITHETLLELLDSLGKWSDVLLFFQWQYSLEFVSFKGGSIGSGSVADPPLADHRENVLPPFLLVAPIFKDPSILKGMYNIIQGVAEQLIT